MNSLIHKACRCILKDLLFLIGEFSGGPVVRMLSLPRAQIQALVKKPRFHMLSSAAKNKQTNKPDRLYRALLIAAQ